MRKSPRHRVRGSTNGRAWLVRPPRRSPRNSHARSHFTAAWPGASNSPRRRSRASLSSRSRWAGDVVRPAFTQGPPERSTPDADLTSLLLSRAGGIPASETPEISLRRVDVPLPRDLVASAPGAFDDWRWAAKGTRTLLFHASRDGDADVVLWFEQELPLAAVAPALEVQRFYASVVSNIDPSAPFLLATKLVQTMALVVSDYEVLLPPGASDAVDRLRQLQESDQLVSTVAWLLSVIRGTEGRELGFGVDLASLSRWKVAGRNDNGAWIRLAETRGWRQQLRPSISASLDVQAFIGFMLPDVPVGEGPTPMQDTPDTASTVGQGDQATLLHRRVEHAGRGLTVAMLCVELPSCTQRGAILAMLESLQLARASHSDVALQERGVGALAAEYDLFVRAMPDWADPVTMAADWLERVTEVEQLAKQLGPFGPTTSGGSGDAAPPVPSTEPL